MKKILFLFCITSIAYNFINAETSKNEAFILVHESPWYMDYLSIDENNSSSRAIIGPTNLIICDTNTYSIDALIGCTFTWSCSNNLTIIGGVNAEVIAVIATGIGTGWVSVLITCGMVSYIETLNITVSFGVIPIYDVYNNYSTTNDMDINTPSIITGSFTINAPHIVVVSADIFATPNAKIIVQPGAMLIVSGATLTNYCPSQMWEGITVYGNIINDPPSHGAVVIENGGKIENAKLAINAVSGGIIETEEAYFINNHIAVQIDAYSEGTFSLSEFIFDDDYLGTPSNFLAQLIIYSSGKEVVVSGCQFLFETTGKYPESYFTAISSFNSSLTVTETPQGIQTTITGFRYGISVSNSGVAPLLNVHNCIFTDNLYDIKLNAVNNPDISKNQFYLSRNGGYGLYVSGSTGYTIEENIFISTDENLSTNGIIISNSGPYENVIHNNDFYFLETGIEALGENSDQSALSTPGLQFTCNYFREIQQTDILVGGYGNPTDHSIRPNQGSSKLPAGNIFIEPDTRLNIDNHSSYGINYYFSVPGFSYEFPHQTSINVFKIPVNEYSDCPSKGKSDFSLSQYDELNNQYKYWLALANEVVNEEDFLTIIEKVSYYSALKDNYFNKGVVATMNAEGSLYENLRFLFNYRNHYGDNLSIVETYLAENKYKEAIAALFSIYEQFELTKEQINELTGLEIYIKWLQQLANEEKTIYMLSSKEVEALIKYVETHSGRGVVFAKNILCVLYDICIENNERERSRTERGIASPTKIEEVNGKAERGSLLDNISVVPNPTTGQLSIVNCQLSINSVEVFDVYGRKLSSHHLIISSSHHQIDISHLSSGLYFVKITTKQGVIVKKVIKQ